MKRNIKRAKENLKITNREEGNGNPLRYSCLGSLMDGGAWWATVVESQRVRHNGACMHACTRDY